MLSIHLPVDR